MEFGAVLKKMRKGADMSQEELAEELHISRSNISRLETNNLELKATDLLNWATATNAQDVLAALVLSVDVTVIQGLLDSVSSLIGTIFLGGII